MAKYIVIAALVVIVFFALKATIKSFKNGGCSCGSGGSCGSGCSCSCCGSKAPEDDNQNKDKEEINGTV